MEQEIILNEHNKQEYPPMHTGESNTSSIVLYTAEDNSIQLDVTLENETVWLSIEQMALLFGRDRTVVSRHIRNIYSEGELTRDITCAKFAHMGIDNDQVYEVQLYNLDVIISVGYRVKSVQGTRFRQWANKVLKDYLIKGYAVNQKITQQRYEELKDVVRLMSRTYQLQESVSTEEADGLLTMIGDYVYALDTLDHYDFQQLTLEKTTEEEPFHATYENAMEAINRLKPKFGGSALFANEKDNSFKSSIGQIYQTFGGEELYPSVEEKAATLLYLVVKNHSFSDGNKRIAAMLFLWFMDRNKVLYAADGHKRIADNTLVALTLMIAESRSEEKDIIIKLVVNLINQNNQ